MKTQKRKQLTPKTEKKLKRRMLAKTTTTKNLIPIHTLAHTRTHAHTIWLNHHTLLTSQLTELQRLKRLRGTSRGFVCNQVLLLYSLPGSMYLLCSTFNGTRPTLMLFSPHTTVFAVWCVLLCLQQSGWWCVCIMLITFNIVQNNSRKINISFGEDLNSINLLRL